jgi:hypothetical protein
MPQTAKRLSTRGCQTVIPFNLNITGIILPDKATPKTSMQNDAAAVEGTLHFLEDWNHQQIQGIDR